MSSPSIFISYSHKDEEWKDQVVMHLRVLEMEGMLDVWDDRRIEAGDDWHAEIDNAIRAASIAILIISANFLTSKFILDDEVPKLLERRIKEGVRVIPVIIKPCAWTQVKWLSQIQARPKDGNPLSAGNEHQINADLAELANEIGRIIKRAGIIPDPKKFIPLPPDKISLAKLPSTSPDLFGRDNTLKELDNAWENLHINIFTIVAWGGAGKSALVSKWLSQIAKDNYRGAERVYGWSFYSQGAAEGRQVSTDQFIASALEWFGDANPKVGSAWEKGERLAELVKQSRNLIILDGLEPLQNPPPVETGRIKDPALLAFLREMARQNPGMIIITTRLVVDNLKDCIGDTVIQHFLGNLSLEAGAAYLKHLGIDGTDIELQNAVSEFDGHALALTLMGRYLVDVYDADIQKRNLIPHLTDEEELGGHAKRIILAYEKWFEDKPEHDLLTLMGLFDRPMEKGALDALLVPPIIDGLTNKIQALSKEKYQLVLKHLRKARLLADQNPHEPNTLDCHPLLREHFSRQLKELHPAAWREGNNRLYRYYSANTMDFPSTLQEMLPLFAAVMHGCQAEKHQEAFSDVFWKRILRSQEESFAYKRLGAYSSVLSMLSYFFDTLWVKPVDIINKSIQTDVLSHTAFCFRALGRTSEAAKLTQSSFANYLEEGKWLFAAIEASNISEIYLVIGNITDAITYAEQSVQLSKRSGDWRRQRINLATLANAQHKAGHLAEAQTAFREAEDIQKKNQPEFPMLYSSRGFEYCDLLLSQGHYMEVIRRANQSLEWVVKFMNRQGSSVGPLDIALDYLSLGRANLLRSQHETNHSFAESLTNLDRAVDNFRQAGTQHMLPLGLLSRAKFYRVMVALDKAQEDLDEVFSIVSRGEMGLHLADLHLEYAKLYLRKGNREKAHENFEVAIEKIANMGYHIRNNEVMEMKTELK